MTKFASIEITANWWLDDETNLQKHSHARSTSSICYITIVSNVSVVYYVAGDSGCMRVWLLAAYFVYHRYLLTDKPLLYGKDKTSVEKGSWCFTTKSISPIFFYKSLKPKRKIQAQTFTFISHSEITSRTTMYSNNNPLAYTIIKLW